VCRTRGIHETEGRRRCVWDISFKPDGKLYLDGLGVGGRLILKWIFEKEGCKGVEWIHLAQDLNECSAVVSQIRGLRFPKERKIFVCF